MLLELVLLASVASTSTLASDICSLPKEVGPCRGQTLRFHYNTTSEKCEAFFYGGCRGNANNFQTLNQCHQSCHHLMSPGSMVRDHVKTAHCFRPPLVGKVTCRGWFPRFTFNSRTLKCESYIYGGCGASANVYTNEEQCLTTCYYGTSEIENDQGTMLMIVMPVSQCGNYGNSLSSIFGKNFVKVTFLLNNY